MHKNHFKTGAFKWHTDFHNKNITGLDVHLLQIQIYFSTTDSTAQLEIIFRRISIKMHSIKERLK
jgi:hypothetical protein